MAHLETEVERLVGELARAHEDIQLGLAREAKLEGARQAAEREALVQPVECPALTAGDPSTCPRDDCEDCPATEDGRQGTWPAFDQAISAAQVALEKIIEQAEAAIGDLGTAHHEGAALSRRAAEADRWKPLAVRMAALLRECAHACRGEQGEYHWQDSQHADYEGLACEIQAAMKAPALARAVELDRARWEVCEAALAEEAADDAYVGTLVHSDSDARAETLARTLSAARERLYAATARLRALLTQEDRDGGH